MMIFPLMSFERLYNNKFCNYKKNNYIRNLLSNLPHTGEELLLIYDIII